jgi:hypothetical protein
MLGIMTREIVAGIGAFSEQIELAYAAAYEAGHPGSTLRFRDIYAVTSAIEVIRKQYKELSGEWDICCTGEYFEKFFKERAARYAIQREEDGFTWLRV